MPTTVQAPQSGNTQMWAKVRIVLGILVAAGKINAIHRRHLNPVAIDTVNQDQFKAMQTTNDIIVAICVAVVIWGVATLWKYRDSKRS